MENEKELNTELKLEDLEGVAGGGIGVSDPAKRPSGMPCPQCKILYRKRLCTKNFYIC